MKRFSNQVNHAFNELWQKHRILITVLIVGFMFDTLSTIHFMAREGVEFEIHPLVKFSALFLGPVAGTILSAFCYKMVVCILLAMYLKQIRLWILLLPSITSTFAGFYNLFG